MSRADFWSMASWHAASSVVPDRYYDYFNAQNGTTFRFLYGREDLCDVHDPNQVFPKVKFPEFKRGVAEILRRFGSTSIHNLSNQEIVALILGGHSLGGAKYVNSNVEGEWIYTNTSIDDTYAHALVKHNWRAQINPMGINQYYDHTFKTEYQDKGILTDYQSMSLNTDIALIKDIQVKNPRTGELEVSSAHNCTETFNDNCPNSLFYEYAHFYTRQMIENKNQFYHDFGAVYWKILNAGYDNLQPADQDSVSQGLRTQPNQVILGFFCLFNLMYFV